jgi:hypothetical protein
MPCRQHPIQKGTVTEEPHGLKFRHHRKICHRFLADSVAADFLCYETVIFNTNNRVVALFASMTKYSSSELEACAKVVWQPTDPTVCFTPLPSSNNKCVVASNYLCGAWPTKFDGSRKL